MPMSDSGNTDILIDISTAILRAHEGELQFRALEDAGESAKRLPFGPFMPDRHRTMEIGLRQWVREQVGVDLAHVEQLYTFADQGRYKSGEGRHVVSVGYLALARAEDASGGSWDNLYRYFPWEDWRHGRPDVLDHVILPALDKWLSDNDDAEARVRLAFGRDVAQWDEEFVLERYELLYQAGLSAEAARDGPTKKSTMDALGTPLQLDHRRILATALGRLRSKLKYRPVLFDLMPDRFTLRALQETTELVIGTPLHKQNFRRLVEKSGFVEATGETSRARGRPAELFRFRHGNRADRPLAGLRVSGGRKTGRAR
jgi:hypothetical protein